MSSVASVGDCFGIRTADATSIKVIAETYTWLVLPLLPLPSKSVQLSLPPEPALHGACLFYSSQHACSGSLKAASQGPRYSGSRPGITRTCSSLPQNTEKRGPCPPLLKSTVRAQHARDHRNLTEMERTHPTGCEQTNQQVSLEVTFERICWSDTFYANSYRKVNKA